MGVARGRPGSWNVECCAIGASLVLDLGPGNEASAVRT